MPISVLGATECAHEHDGSCSYVKGESCQHEHDEGCNLNGGTASPGNAGCDHEHDEGCGYVEAVPCDHEHDEECDSVIVNDLDTTDEANNIITGFKDIEPINVDLGTKLEDIHFPSMIDAVIGNGNGNDDITEQLVVKEWTCSSVDDYDPDIEAFYIFEASLDIPADLFLDPDAELPFVCVMVGEADLLNGIASTSADNWLEIDDSGTYWLIKDGILTIKGDGAIPNFYSDVDTPWKAEKDNIKGLEIQQGITAIGNYTFSKYDGITGELVIPDSVTSIGAYSFRGCSGFTGDLTIPDSVETIGQAAFWDCGGFDGELTISENDSLTTLSRSAFSECSSLTGDLKIPDNITTIESDVFSVCKGMTGNLILSESLESIGSNAFNGCERLSGELKIPDGVTSIGYQAFYGCKGFSGDLTIPDGITLIDNYTFYNCIGFSGKLTLPDSLESLGNKVFQYCSGLESVIMPGNTVTFGDGVFDSCTSIKSLTMGDKTVNMVAYPSTAGAPYLEPISSDELEIYANGKGSVKFDNWALEGGINGIAEAGMENTKFSMSVVTGEVNLVAYFTGTGDVTAPKLTAGAVTRTSDTKATVKFTSDEEGKYYYKIVEAEASQPYINTDATGSICTTSETTISLANLTAGAKDIYIVVKDAVGNVSDRTFKITIPAFGTSLQLIKIEMKQGPSKTAYTAGETFDSTGMVITATYSDGSTKDVTSYMIDPSGALTVNDTYVTVQYTEGGVAKTVQVAITVNEKSDGNSGGSSGGGSSSSGSTASWQSDSNGNWRYYTSSGNYVVNEWKLLSYNGSTFWFHFGGNGYINTGWFQDADGSWYYLNPISDGSKGAMQQGWITDPQDGNRYYLDPVTGRMATGWLEIDGVWYYFNESGSDQSGWTWNTERGEWIYSNQGGKALGMLEADKKR